MVNSVKVQHQSTLSAALPPKVKQAQLTESSWKHLLHAVTSCLRSHATSEFFCLAVNPVVSQAAPSRDGNSNVPSPSMLDDLRVWHTATGIARRLCEKHKAWQRLFLFFLRKSPSHVSSELYCVSLEEVSDRSK